MSVLLTGSEDALLLSLWRLSLLLTLGAVIVALGLVLRRQHENRVDKKRAVRRKELERVLWGAINARVMPSAASLPALNYDDVILVCDIALNILRPLRGAEAARIILVIETWPIRDHLARMLKRGKRSERIRILTLLGHFDDDASLLMLKQWINAEDFYVQLAALRSLAARHATEALPEILQHLAKAKRQNAIMLADVLRRFGEQGIDMLAALTVSSAEMEIRLAAVTAMEAIGSLLAVPALIKIANDPIPDIRAHAIGALGKLADMRADQVILRALDDAHEGVRVRAAKAAGRMHLRAAAPKLAASLADPSWWVRYRAAEALYAMGAVGHSFLNTRSKKADHAGRIAAQVLAENRKEAA